MAADVVGYSRMMEANEASTIKALEASRLIFREQVEASAGRIVDTAGDSVLAIFNSATNAVNAAKEIQTALEERNRNLVEFERMRFRIGINLGEVIERSDGSIYGSGVNIAARLESLCKPGKITISANIREQVQGKFDSSYSDLGTFAVKNIEQPIRAFELSDTQVAGAPRRTYNRLLRNWRRNRVAFTTGIVLIIAGIVYLTTKEETGNDADFRVSADELSELGPTIAVLPFDNLSSDSSQEFFADGLTEDIITALSHFKELAVIARNSTFQYKGKPVDIRNVGLDLGANFVLEGSVRRAGETIRVVAQLINADDGAHVWARTFDRELSSIFEIQDDITAQVVGNLTGVTGQIARSRLVEISNETDLAAYDLLHKADALWIPEQSFENHQTAIKLIERAIAIDPNYATAIARLSYYYHVEQLWGYKPDGGGLAKSCDLARQAIAMQATNAFAHHMLALCHFFSRDIRSFRTESDLSISLNPNAADVIAYLGLLTLYAGDWEIGGALCKRAISLNPETPAWYFICLTYFHVRQDEYEDALFYAKKADIPGQYWSKLRLAVIYVHLEMMSEARAAHAALLEMNPNFDAWQEHIAWNFNPELTSRINVALNQIVDTPLEPDGLVWDPNFGWVDSTSDGS